MVLFLFVTWEQRKLGGEAEELLAGGDIDKDLICESGRYPVIANALTNDGIVGFYEKYYRVEAPAVTVTGRGDVGHAQARRVNFTPVVRLLSIKSRHNVDFLENAINRGEVIIESTGVPQLTVPQLSKRTISFPQTVQEEEKIGKLFFKIDNLITLHQRKQKCKFLSFPTSKAGLFLANSWEQRKAKTLFISYAEKGYPELPVLSATQDKGMVYRDDTGKNIFHDKNNEISYKRVQPGQFVIHLRSFQGGFAHSNILGITSPAYTIFGFKDDEKQCDLYWKYVFCSSEFVKRLEAVTYGIRDGRSISYDEFLIMKFIVPKYEEQVQIASILIEIDNLITLHQCKDFALDTNKAFQQRCLLSIKSANAWEQRKVGELLIERNEQTPKSDEYPLMAFIANEGVAPKGERYDRSSLINDTENKLYKRTEYGDFIYSSNNLETGSIGVNKYGNATISPVYSIFYTTELADSDFIGRRLIRKDFINEMVKWRQGVIYGQWRIHEDDFVKIKICVPKTCEQRKIGAILDNLDNLITLHQRGLIKIQGDKKWQKRKFQKNCSAIILNAG